MDVPSMLTTSTHVHIPTACPPSIDRFKPVDDLEKRKIRVKEKGEKASSGL